MTRHWLIVINFSSRSLSNVFLWTCFSQVPINCSTCFATHCFHIAQDSVVSCSISSEKILLKKNSSKVKSSVRRLFLSRLARFESAVPSSRRLHLNQLDSSREFRAVPRLGRRKKCNFASDSNGILHDSATVLVRPCSVGGDNREKTWGSCFRRHGYRKRERDWTCAVERLSISVREVIRHLNFPNERFSEA